MGAVEDLSGVRILWESDWWDGPISGVAEYRSRQGWFHAAWDRMTDDWEWPRRLVLYELTSDELDREWSGHRLFEAKVSTKHCHHDDAPAPVVHPQSEWSEFYDLHPASTASKYEDHPVIGWFWAAEGKPRRQM
jgi:hypothetical protein